MFPASPRERDSVRSAQEEGLATDPLQRVAGAENTTRSVDHPLTPASPPCGLATRTESAVTGRSHHFHVIAIAVTAALLAAACKPSTDAPATPATPMQQAPAAADTPAAAQPAHAGNDDTAISAFLVSTYGPDATLAGEWGQLPNDRALLAEGGEQDGTVTRRVCEHERIQYKAKPAVLLAVCGVPKDFGHPTPGITDFFLLQGEPLAVVAQSHLQEFGSMGNAGEVESERFGADLPGFTVESGFTGQGHTTVHRSILLPKDGRFQEAATLLSSMDDTVLREGCTSDADVCAPEKAYDIEFDLDIDDSQAAAQAYPLQVQEEGKACGKPVDARYTLTLDPATLRYDVPAALRRELPCAAGA